MRGRNDSNGHMGWITRTSEECRHGIVAWHRILPTKRLLIGFWWLDQVCWSTIEKQLELSRENIVHYFDKLKILGKENILDNRMLTIWWGCAQFCFWKRQGMCWQGKMRLGRMKVNFDDINYCADCWRFSKDCEDWQMNSRQDWKQMRI